MTDNFFEALEREKPGNIKNLGIRRFVRNKFDAITAVRDKGYSWPQIAKVVHDKLAFPSKNLTQSLATAYRFVKASREKLNEEASCKKK